ncbi:MAG: ABC transporter permease [Deltaproteobacteria bacterium]|nr:ABC transporter permease [Deltaproteobacteria bacterium]
MSGIMLIAGRELKAYLRSPLGYIAASAALLLAGILFIARALGGAGAKRLSAEVLRQFFYNTSGVVMALGLLLAFRLIAHEQEHGTLVLLKTSPVRDRDVVLGKFLAVLALVTVVTGFTAYMPALIFVNGKVSVGHIMVGYLGVLLAGSAAIAIGLFASALAKNQVIAIIVGGAILGTLVLLWLLRKVTEPPVMGFVDGLAIHHFRQRDFNIGVLRLENVVYYFGVVFFFLLAATKTLEARRWR